MDKLKEKLSRLMYGRYGIDQLGNFMMWAAVAMMIFGAVVRSSLIYTLALVLIVWADVRIMSKNHYQTVCGKPEIPGTEKPRRRILPRRNPCIQG